MKERELIQKRGLREKHFLQNDGTIVAQVYNENIHYLKNGKFEEIDNSLIYKNEFYENNQNSFKVQFPSHSENGLLKLVINNDYIFFKLKNCNNVEMKKEFNKSKYHQKVCYENILENIDFSYDIYSSKIKESIVIKKATANFKNIELYIKTNLLLEMDDNGYINALKNNNCIYKFDVPFMIDAKGDSNKDVQYKLEKINDGYMLKLIVDDKWILSDDRSFPIVIDPTIDVGHSGYNVYDTYIYPGDTGVYRGGQTYLKVGVEKVNNVNVPNRALIKIELPVGLGTGDQIIKASLNLFALPGLSDIEFQNYNRRYITVHRITQDWTEGLADWSSMNDKFDPHIIDWFYGYRRTNNQDLYPDTCNITELVKKWYEDTPNYGIMLKDVEEIYANDKIPMFFSKDSNPNNNENNSPVPYLVIQYQDLNGLEKYWNYTGVKFYGGNYFVNNYNGNLITSIPLLKTFNAKFPIDLKMVYNIGWAIAGGGKWKGRGWQLNYQHMLYDYWINGEKYLEYSDEDGGAHFFRKSKEILNTETNIVETLQEQNTYYDEDGLELTITEYNDYYILVDKNNNKMKFAKWGTVSAVEEIEDTNGNKITLHYNNISLMDRITDSNNNVINIVYGNNQITISGQNQTIILYYSNDEKLLHIESSNGDMYFTYDNNFCMTNITDFSNLKYNFEYYDNEPFKIKKITEYGVNNTEGSSLNFIYSLNSTVITDNNGKANTITFKNTGTPSSITSAKSHNNIFDAFGTYLNYNEQYQMKNKLSSLQTPIKYIKNYLTNTSFEDSSSHGFSSHEFTNMAVDNSVSFSGTKSLKTIINGTGEIYKIVNVEKGKYYTFTAYVKSDCNATLCLYCGASGENGSVTITPSSSFEKYVVTSFFPTDLSNEDLGDIIIKFQFNNENGNFYIDDVQLEEGEISNIHNYLDNSDFSNGTTGYSLSNDLTRYEVVTLPNGRTALKIKMAPNKSTGFSREINISGETGDTYNLSFWYKNEGLEYESLSGQGEKTNNLIIQFYYIDSQEGIDVVPEVLHSNKDEWQFFSYSFTAEKDFSKIIISFWEDNNANDLYITNMSLFKNIKRKENTFDKRGNISGIKDLNNNLTQIQYTDNNELNKIIDSVGNVFVFEYDKNVINRVINSISQTGVTNKIDYNANNKIDTIKCRNYKQNIDLDEGLFNLRLKGCEVYLRMINANLYVVNDSHNHDLWNFTKVGEFVKINHSIINTLYLCYNGNYLSLGLYNPDTCLFKLIKNEDCSYSLQIPNSDTKIRLNHNYINTLYAPAMNTLDEDFEFFAESPNSKIFIETNTKYTDDGNDISSFTGSTFKKFLYQYDSNTGLCNSVTMPSGQTINYTYNSKQLLTNVTKGSRYITFNYDNLLLNKINLVNKEYNIIYNEFLKVSSIKVGNNITLFTKEFYQNNGKIKNILYGNNQKIECFYDDFERLSILKKGLLEYNYKYDSMGNISKVISETNEKNMYFDLSNRLEKYCDNNMELKVQYSDSGNILHKEYKLKNYPNSQFPISYSYNIDDSLTSMLIGSTSISYIFDELDRIDKQTINNIFETKYKYITNGNRTSLVINGYENLYNNYFYKYDKSGNIIDIYNNGILENKYRYNEYNELIEDINYNLNKIFKYTYNLSGNITSSKEFDLTTNSLISENTFIYSNSNWIDQLSAFNNESITYDNIGNPVSIGDKTLTWENGYELKSYVDGNTIINYKYDESGIRIEKNVNNSITKFNTINDKIIFEEKTNQYIYYLYDNADNLIGLNLYDANNNSTIYYYLKNLQGDVIGIMDNNFNLIAKYTYDSYGNIISIVDSNDNDLSNNSNHIANINPIRYRGYYYDIETDLYYLGKRYYNPKWCRFINSDKYIEVNDSSFTCNLYQYALNNPINYYDPTGNKINIFKAIGDTYTKVKKTATKIVKTIKKTVSNAINTAEKVINKAVDTAVKVYNVVSNIVSTAAKISYEIGKPIPGSVAEFHINSGVKEKDFPITAVDTDVIGLHSGELYIGKEHDVGVDGGPLGFHFKAEEGEQCLKEKSCDINFEPVLTLSKDIVTFEFHTDGTVSLFIGLEADFAILSGFGFKLGWEMDGGHLYILGPVF